MSRRFLVPIFAVVAMLSLFFMPGASAIHSADDHTANMSLVKNIRYQIRNQPTTTNQGGSDIEFARLGSPPRWYALAGTYWNGLQIVDIAWPPRAQIVGVYDCGITQGDVQVFTQADEPGRTFVTYTSDQGARTASKCYQDAKALGDWGTGQSNFGTFIADITDPRNPVTLAFVPIAKGSHNQTVHPSGNYLYNSNSDLATDISPSIEIWNITDINNPVFVRNLPMPIRPGLGSDSHDVTFNTTGTRAYTAAISHTSIIDTTNPANPVVLNTIFDPTVNVSHQADPVTMRDPITGLPKTFVIVSDELVGAAGNYACPGGGLHVYDVTNDAFTKVGFWVTDYAGQTQSPASIPVCTSHVFRIHEKEKLLTIAWYSAGVRVVDISQLAGFTLGSTGSGMREIGHYRTPDADTWAAKTPFIDSRSGDFWLFGNDIGRGLDIYHFDADGQQNMSQNPGTWESGPGAGAQDTLPITNTPYDLSADTHVGQ
jgi:hypothetical protein